MKKGCTVLVTGGTGSFGRIFTKLTLDKSNPKKIIIYSRDEMKQWDMSQSYLSDSRVKFVIGDVRDQDRLASALSDVDYVVHAAATKIVPTAEYNPSECVKTNIDGAMNVINACKSTGVQSVVALSTDKASNPINLYGATKLASDKLFVAANTPESSSPSFSVVRYGNVMGSRGSVIPFFLRQALDGQITITDPRMTRFMITLEQAVQLVWHAFNDSLGGEIYVKKIPSMNILSIADAISPTSKKTFIGIRPGEKIHEQMIGIEDAHCTYQYHSHYKILPMLHAWSSDPSRIKDGKLVPDDFSYTSDNNTDWMSIESLREWIKYSMPKLAY